MSGTGMALIGMALIIKLVLLYFLHLYVKMLSANTLCVLIYIF